MKTSGAAIKCDQPRSFGGIGRLDSEDDDGNGGNDGLEFFNAPPL